MSVVTAGYWKVVSLTFASAACYLLTLGLLGYWTILFVCDWPQHSERDRCLSVEKAFNFRERRILVPSERILTSGRMGLSF